MAITLTFTNGAPDQTFDSIQDAARAAEDQYPGCVVYDAGGFKRHSYFAVDSNYDVRDGRAALIWRNEAESVNDDGARAVASINVED
jgi:hypothetical protein